MTLPYLDFHLMELGPASPDRSIPRGKIHKLVPTSIFSFTQWDEANSLYAADAVNIGVITQFDPIPRLFSRIF